MFLERLRTKSIARAGSILIAGSLVLTACARIDNIRQEFIGNNTSDPCNSHREALVETREDFSKTISQGAIAGAATGAIVGLMTGGDLKSAVMGAAIGGLAGAAAGYFKAKHDEAKTRQELIAAIRGDFAVDNQRLDKAGQAVRKITQCRSNEYETILADFKARRIDRNTALARKEAVKSKIERDRKLIELLLEGSEKRAEDYASALNAGFELPRGELIKEQPTGSQMALQQMQLTVSDTPMHKYKKYIAIRNANVRSKPSTRSAIVGKLTGGERIHVIAGNESKSWKPIMRPNGETAYVYGTLIAAEGSKKASRVLAKLGKKLGNKKTHDFAYKKVSKGVDGLLAMQQRQEAKLLFLEESITRLFYDDDIMMASISP